MRCFTNELCKFNPRSLIYHALRISFVCTSYRLKIALTVTKDHK